MKTIMKIINETPNKSIQPSLSNRFSRGRIDIKTFIQRILKQSKNILRCSALESFRALMGKWFAFAAVGTLIFLWLGIGTDSFNMLRSDQFTVDRQNLIYMSLTSESTALSLPALAALPAAAMALTELRTGIFRAKVFRSGRAAWRTGKIISCITSAALSQAVGLLAFSLVLWVFELKRGSVEVSSVESGVLGGMIFARLLAGAAFACFGAALSLATGSAATAYVAPMAACFTLKLLGSRFFLETRYIDPIEWLSGDKFALTLLWFILAATLILFDIILRKEMERHG